MTVGNTKGSGVNGSSVLKPSQTRPADTVQTSAVHAVFGERLKHGTKQVLTSFAAGIVLIAALNLAVRFF